MLEAVVLPLDSFFFKVDAPLALDLAWYSILKKSTFDSSTPMKKMIIFSYLNISPMQNFYFSAQLLEFLLAYFLFPSHSPPEEPVRGAVAGLGIDSK